MVEKTTMLGNLNLFVNALGRLESRGIAVEAKRCTRLRHRIASCTRCSEVCPTEAIQWGEDSLLLDPDKCTGCGACATVCPTAALEAKSPSDVQLHAAAKARVKDVGAAAFACERYLKASACDRSRVIEVSCLARIDESILISAVAAGAASVQMFDGACATCRQEKAWEIAAKAAASANALLAAWGKPSLVKLGRQTSTAMEKARVEIRPMGGMSRRGFFTVLRGETAEVASGAIAGVVGATEAAKKRPPRQVSLDDYRKHVPEKRRYLLASLKALGQPVAQKLCTSLWAKVTIAGNCTGCQGCVTFCPTGALTKFEHGGQAGISFQTSDCTDCMLCEDICQRALRTGSLTATQPIELTDVLQPTSEVLIAKPKEQFMRVNAKMEDKLAALLNTTIVSYS
jgi:ferredoxin